MYIPDVGLGTEIHLQFISALCQSNTVLRQMLMVREHSPAIEACLTVIVLHKRLDALGDHTTFWFWVMKSQILGVGAMQLEA